MYQRNRVSALYSSFTYQVSVPRVIHITYTMTVSGFADIYILSPWVYGPRASGVYIYQQNPLQLWYNYYIWYGYTTT